MSDTIVKGKRYTVTLRRTIIGTCQVEVEVPKEEEDFDALAVDWSAVQSDDWEEEECETEALDVKKWTEQEMANPDFRGAIDYVIDEDGELEAV